jgi:hypothetical protein
MVTDFFALLWGNELVLLLLGVMDPPPPQAMSERARQATEKFLKLYG